MKLKSATLLIALFILNGIVFGQTDPPKKHSKQEKREAKAKADAAKADALMQKDEIYDKQVLERKEESSSVKQNRVNQNRAGMRFHKRKLSHRLRRRRF